MRCRRNVYVLIFPHDLSELVLQQVSLRSFRHASGNLTCLPTPWSNTDRAVMKSSRRGSRIEFPWVCRFRRVRCGVPHLDGPPSINPSSEIPVRNVRLLADVGERRVDPSVAEIGAQQPLEGAVEPRTEGWRNRAHRGPGHRVPGAPEPHRHRKEQLTWRRRRQHGPFQLHLAPAPRGLLRSPLLLHAVQRQEWGLRRRGLPTKRGPGYTPTQDVRILKIDNNPK